MRVTTFITALVACLVIVVSCTNKESDNNGACNAGYENAIKSLTPFVGYPVKQYTGQPTNDLVIYYQYIVGSPSKVQFFLGWNAKPVCTNEHMKIDYAIYISKEPQTLSMKIFGDAYWSAFDDEIILFNGIPTSGATYRGSLSVGLKQAFSQGGGDVDAFANVEFTSTGNFSSDSSYFVKHVEIMEVKSKFSKF